MTEQRNTVVPNFRPLTEQAFRDTWLLTLARLCRQHGDSTVALWLGVSERHLRNIKAGTALPTADKLWNLLAYDPSAHDELDGEYGLRNVGKNEVCSSDPLTLSLITLARDVAEAEAPDSPGGHTVTDTELRGMDESLLRKVHRVTGTWLERIEEVNSARRAALAAALSGKTEASSSSLSASYGLPISEVQSAMRSMGVNDNG